MASVSKAALVPGRDAAAYGGSKAAELGGDRIRVNAINADQIETPLFLEFVPERAAGRGVTVEEQVEFDRRRAGSRIRMLDRIHLLCHVDFSPASRN